MSQINADREVASKQNGCQKVIKNVYPRTCRIVHHYIPENG